MNYINNLFAKIIKYLKRSHNQVLMFTVPPNMIRNEWVMVEATFDNGKVPSNAIISAQLKIKYNPI